MTHAPKCPCCGDDMERVVWSSGWVWEDFEPSTRDQPGAEQVRRERRRRDRRKRARQARRRNRR